MASGKQHNLDRLGSIVSPTSRRTMATAVFAPIVAARVGFGVRADASRAVRRGCRVAAPPPPPFVLLGGYNPPAPPPDTRGSPKLAFLIGEALF